MPVNLNDKPMYRSWGAMRRNTSPSHSPRRTVLCCQNAAQPAAILAGKPTSAPAATTPNLLVSALNPSCDEALHAEVVSLTPWQ